MNFVTVAGNTIHYAVEGVAGGPALVFINSLGTDLRIWDEVASGFLGRFRVVRYDKRGHGLSDAPPGPYSIRAQTQDLAGLLDHLKIDSAVLGGISVGGLIAMDYALQAPGRVRALVLCDTAARIGTAVTWNERMQTVREQGLDALAETLTGRWFTPAFASHRPAERRGYVNLLARMPAQGYIATCAVLRDADLRRTVKDLSVPALVVCGAEDMVTTPQMGQELAASLPRARFEVIEGAAHLPCIEKPGAVVAAIQRFLEENGYA